MDEVELRRRLYRIGSDITEGNLQTMKFLCKDKVGESYLERAKSVIDFFKLLITRNLIGPSNLKFLEEILDKSSRKDLVGKIRTSGGEVESEGPLTTPGLLTSNSSSGNENYRTFLNQLCDELTKDDVESLKFLFVVPGAIEQDITSGLQLMDHLEKRGIIKPSDLSVLAKNFEVIHRNNLSEEVKKYSGRESDKTPLPPISRLTISTEPTEAQEHSEHTGAIPVSPRAPLLTPQHFIRTIITLPPAVPLIVPIEPGPRNPVQCGDDLPPLDQEDDMPSYPMRNRPRGYALIFSNRKFSGNDNLRERQGTEKDVENLKNLWKNLHFEVVVLEEKTADEMENIAGEYSSRDHSNFDCFVCCLLSHGVHGSIYGSDSKLLELRKITSQFNGSACPTLLDKPKLFFIQACRGKEFDHGAQADAVGPNSEEYKVHLISAEPIEAHFLIGYATPPDYVSWRSPEHGSWYVSKLCKVFGKYCEKCHVTDMVVMVNDEVSEACTGKGYKQCPAPVVTLRKRIYLNNN